jgi:uncharacterized membrane protein HdeD (DUF308 family)
MYAVRTLAAHWWIVLLRGVVALIFGALIFAFPLNALAAFVIVFGAYALVDGLFAIVAALRLAHPDSGRWWALLQQGIAGVAAGGLTFFWPQITALSLGILVAVWAFVTGFLEIGAAIRMRKDVPNEILLFVTGLISIALGAYLAFQPFVALLASVWVIGAYAIVTGIVLVVLSFRLRGLKTA